MTDQQRRQGKGGGGEPSSSENKNVAFAINSLHRTYQAASDKATEREARQFKWSRRTAAAAIIYTVITAAILAAGIWSAIQATNAVGEATQAVGEAKRSADAAQAQVATARDTEQRQLMAYVGVAQHGIENFGKPNQVIKVSRKNYGVTPAIDLIMSPPAAVIAEKGKGYFLPITCNPAPALQNSFALFPTQEAPFEYRGLAPGVSKEQIDQVRSGSHQIIYFGAAFYKDIFGNQHCTRFCWGFGGQSMAENDVELCAQHNDTH
jgi:hypothetical protein